MILAYVFKTAKSEILSWFRHFLDAPIRLLSRLKTLLLIPGRPNLPLPRPANHFHTQWPVHHLSSQARLPKSLDS